MDNVLLAIISSGLGIVLGHYLTKERDIYIRKVEALKNDLYVAETHISTIEAYNAYREAKTKGDITLMIRDAHNSLALFCKKKKLLKHFYQYSRPVRYITIQSPHWQDCIDFGTIAVRNCI